MALVLDGEPDRAVPRCERAARGVGRVAEPALVVRAGGEGAELGPQPPGLGEEEPPVGRHGLVLAEQVRQHREARALGVGALRDLWQLVRVAEENERAGGGADREDVGERELPRLVDEEHVERALGRVDVDRLAGERPRGAGDELVRRVGADVRILRRFDRRDERRLLLVRVPARRAPRNAKPCLSASCWIARSMLWIALWLSEVTPTRLPSRISAIAIRAPCHVFPDPGGPWTKR